MKINGRTALYLPFLHAPQKGGGGGTVTPPADPENELDEETTPPDAATEDSDLSEEELAAALRIATGDTPDPDEDEDKPPPADTTPPATDADTTPPELTDEQLRDMAAKRGLTLAPAQETQPPADTATAPPEIPDYRAQAFAEAKKYPQFLEESDDPDDPPVLTQAGISWAENRAIELAVNHTTSQQQERTALAQIQASKPKIAEDAKAYFIQHYKVKDELADRVAKDYADILSHYGLPAFDDGANEPDPAKKAQKQKNAHNLRTTAAFIALGMESARQYEAQMEGGEEGDKPKEPVNNGHAGQGGLYDGISKEDALWIRDEWVPKQNNGKPPTRAQILQLKKDVFDK